MAIDMFLQIPSPVTKGEATAPGFEDAIEITSFSFGISNSAHSAVGGGLGAGKASFDDFVMTKRVDASSPILMQHCATGEHIPAATFTVRKQGGSGQGQVSYYIVVMSDLMISHVSNAGAAEGDLPTETVAINYTKIDFGYKKQDKTGALGAKIPFLFDLKKATNK